MSSSSSIANGANKGGTSYGTELANIVNAEYNEEAGIIRILLQG